MLQRKVIKVYVILPSIVLESDNEFCMGAHIKIQLSIAGRDFDRAVSKDVWRSIRWWGGHRLRCLPQQIVPVHGLGLKVWRTSWVSLKIPASLNRLRCPSNVNDT
jgi:hypothetical protein